MAKRITFEVPNDTSIVQQNNHFSAVYAPSFLYRIPADATIEDVSDSLPPVKNGLYYTPSGTTLTSHAVYRRRDSGWNVLCSPGGWKVSMGMDAAVRSGSLVFLPGE